MCPSPAERRWKYANDPEFKKRVLASIQKYRAKNPEKYAEIVKKSRKPYVSKHKRYCLTEGCQKRVRINDLCEKCLHKHKLQTDPIYREKIQEYYRAYEKKRGKRIRIKRKLPSKEQRRNQQRKYRRTVHARLKRAIIRRVQKATGKRLAWSKLRQWLGCSVPSLKLYLESKFKTDMAWDNWSLTGWHIDHIRPLRKITEDTMHTLPDLIHYTNLQPLWAKENYEKDRKEKLAHRLI